MKTLLIKLKVLYQLNFRQAMLLITGFIAGKIKGRNPKFISQDIFVMGDHLSDLLENNNKIRKIGNLNLIEFRGNSQFNGLKLYLRRMTTDFNIYGQVFKFGEYQSVVDIINKDAKKKIEYIVDAGANIGCSSLFFKKNFPDAKVISIEPQKGNFEALERNININNYTDITPIQAGLWKDNSNLEINTDFRDGREHSFSLKPSKTQTKITESVKGITIQDLLIQYKIPYIDILKIDIEGAEKYLFESEELAYSNFSKVNYLAIEIHDEVVDRKLIYSVLTDLGFVYQTFQATLVAYRQ